MAVKLKLTSAGSNISDLLDVYVSPNGSSWAFVSTQTKTLLLSTNGYVFTPPIGTQYYEIRDTGSCGTVLALECTTTTTTTAYVPPATTTTTTAYVPPATTTTTTAYVPPATTTTTTAYVPPATTTTTSTTDGGGTTTTTTTAYVPPATTTTTTTAYVPPATTTTTTTITVPTVVTSSISAITQTTATGGGNVTSEGGSTVTVKGICWSTSTSPTISDSKTTNGTGLGIYISSMTSLTDNTIYYVRAYATNAAGTSYGSELSFTTSIYYYPISLAYYAAVGNDICDNNPDGTLINQIYTTVDGGGLVNNRVYYNSNGTLFTDPHASAYYATSLGDGSTTGYFGQGSVWIETATCGPATTSTTSTTAPAYAVEGMINVADSDTVGSQFAVVPSGNAVTFTVVITADEYNGGTPEPNSISHEFTFSTNGNYNFEFGLLDQGAYVVARLQNAVPFTVTVDTDLVNGLVLTTSNQPIGQAP